MTHLHPALAVACPTCGADPQHRCSIRGRELGGVHATRVEALNLRNRATGTIRGTPDAPQT